MRRKAVALVYAFGRDLFVAFDTRVKASPRELHQSYAKIMRGAAPNDHNMIAHASVNLQPTPQ